MQTVTIFKSLFDNSPKYYDVKYVLETFRRPRPEIDQIRSTKDKDERDRLKKTLAVVLFSGEFSARKISAMKTYSRLIVLDFDNVTNTKGKKAQLALLPFIYATWISPGGDGVKALVRVASDNHIGHFLALQKELPDIDISGKDVSRACFVSYDPELYINEAADVYGKVVETAYTDEQKLEKLKKWLENKGAAFVEGSRNNFVHTLASACNRFGLSRKFVEETFIKDYCGSDFREREALQAIGSAYSRVQDFNTASFDDSFSQEEIKSILTTDVDTPDIIRAKDVEQDMLKEFEEGVKPGETTYFPVLDDHFRWMRGEVNLLTGTPNSGKSFVMQQLMLIKAVFDKTKWAILSLEQWPPTFFYRELIRALVGKPVEKNAPGRMTLEEYKRGLEFVHEHFFFIYPKKDEPSPEWTLARFVEAQIKYGISGACIDPHNSQDHESSKYSRDDKYIGAMLNKYKKFSLQNNVYFVDVAHPKNVGKDDDGCFKEPAADDISGGHIWYSKADNILVFHRPGAPVVFSDTCTLRSVKIKKQQQNGRLGMTTFNYRLDTGRYYEDGYNPMNDLKL